MWFLGALIGAMVAGSIGFDFAIVGAIVGGAIGWFLGAQRRRAADDRLQAIEERIIRLENRLAQIEEGASALAAAPLDDLADRAGQSEPLAPSEPASDQARDVVGPAATAAVTAEPAARPEVVAGIRMPALPAQPPAATLLPAASDAGIAAAGPTSLWERLLRGNLMARAGVVVLFFGVAFLLKYGYQHVHLPIELRLLAVALLAIALLAVGWRLRERGGYGLALQGGGVGLLYLTIFGALRLFEVLPAGLAFVLLFVVAVLSAALAVLQDARVLAVLGVAGGFLAPVLASSGSGGLVGLFSYYAVLNGAILAIAWFKAWRIVNVTGFVFTFGVATAFGALRYSPDNYYAAQPFLILFFLIYVAIPLLFARREAGRRERYLDTTLVFGVPLVGFGLQIGLVRSFAYGSAGSALALGAFYLLLARALWARRGEGLRLLVESFIALGIVFTTLAIPLAFDGRWTSAAWALEGAAIVWIGVRQQRLLARVFGMLLQLLAGFFYLGDLHWRGDAWPLLNSVFLGALLLASSGLLCAWLLQRSPQGLHTAERWLAIVFFGWGSAWWIFAGMHEIDAHVRSALQGNALLAFFSGSSLAFSELTQRLRWPLARYPALALLPVMAVLALLTVFHDPHPFAHFGYLVWPAAFIVQLWLLRRHEVVGKRWSEYLHAGGLWLFAALGAWEVAWAIDTWVAGRAAWPLIAWALVPGALLALLAIRGERIAWPVATHFAAYLIIGALPLALFLGAWFLFSNVVADGNPWPLPYVPLLNPLDLAQAGALLAIGIWLVEVRRRDLPPLAAIPVSVAWSLAAAAIFFWANAVLLRTLHHWAGVPLQMAPLLGSALVQAALSLFWTLLALAVMVFAARRAARALWLAGATLLAVVVGKLFLIDLSNVGTIARIVSFLGVGGLMLVIGYLAPAPPKDGEKA